MMFWIKFNKFVLATWQTSGNRYALPYAMLEDTHGIAYSLYSRFPKEGEK